MQDLYIYIYEFLVGTIIIKLDVIWFHALECIQVLLFKHYITRVYYPNTVDLAGVLVVKLPTLDTTG